MNFGVQQQFTNNLVLSISYVGAFSRKLPLYIDHNAPIYNTRRTRTPIPPATSTAAALTMQCRSQPAVRQPAPTRAVGSKYYSNAYVIKTARTRTTTACRSRSMKRLSHDFSVNGYYVWSKSLASASLQTTGNIGNSAGTEPEDYHDLSLERQLTDNDMRNQVVDLRVYGSQITSATSTRFVRTVLNGWSIAAIVSMHSGKPFAITTGTDDNFDGDNNDRPNIVPGKVRDLSLHAAIASHRPSSSGSTPPPIARTAPPVARRAPARRDSMGWSGSTGLTAPGYRDVDASLFRDFTIMNA